MMFAADLIRDVFAPIVVALIAGGSSVLAVRRLSKQNTLEHEHNSGLIGHLSGQIQGIDRKVDRLDERHDNIQLWQAEHEHSHLGESASHRVDL
jgi:hypothetical protein